MTEYKKEEPQSGTKTIEGWLAFSIHHCERLKARIRSPERLTNKQLFFHLEEAIEGIRFAWDLVPLSVDEEWELLGKRLNNEK